MIFILNKNFPNNDFSITSSNFQLFLFYIFSFYNIIIYLINLLDILLYNLYIKYYYTHAHARRKLLQKKQKVIKLSSFQLKEFKYLRFIALFLVLWVNISVWSIKCLRTKVNSITANLLIYTSIEKILSKQININLQKC